MITSIQLQNLGTINKNRVVIKKNDDSEFILYFSYDTIVGIEYWTKEWHEKAVRENIWSTTTGKLLNEIEPDKKRRIGKEEFDNEVAEMFAFINAK